MSFLDAWVRWADGDPTLQAAHLWGLTINSWAWIGSIVLLLGGVALILDVRASPFGRPKSERIGSAGCLLRVLIATIVFLAIGAFIHAVAEESRETGHSVVYVLFAGEDAIDWAGAPRWYNLGMPSLFWLAVLLWNRARLRDWFIATIRKGPRAVVLRLLAFLLTLTGLTFAVLAT